MLKSAIHFAYIFTKFHLNKFQNSLLPQEVLKLDISSFTPEMEPNDLLRSSVPRYVDWF